MCWLILVMFSGVLADLPLRPTYLPCKREDIKCTTDLVQWLYSTTISGISELKIETLDPMYQELIEGKLPYVKYNLTKTNIEGFKTCKINVASVNSNLNNLHLELMCRRFHMDGIYAINGKILSYPIRGQGTYYIDTTNNLFVTDMDLGFKEKNGIKHIYLKSFKYTTDMQGELDFDLRNLFDGNENLARPVMNFAKQNSKLFTSLLQDPIIRANIKKLIKSFNQRFWSIPAEDLLILN